MPGNSHKSGGKVFRSRRPDSYYFDRLPAGARRALANAAFDWASGAVYRAWRRGAPGFATDAEIARSIANWDEETTKEQRQ
jgi:hypothetical protein